MTTMKNATTLLILLILVACIPLRSSDRARLAELRSAGISATEQATTSAPLAGALNILPGFGNFYLGGTSEHNTQWAFGFLNLLLWPASVVWSIPQAALDANTANKLATIDYYFHTPQGKAELAKRQQQLKK